MPDRFAQLVGTHEPQPFTSNHFPVFFGQERLHDWDRDLVTSARYSRLFSPPPANRDGSIQADRSFQEQADATAGDFCYNRTNRKPDPYRQFNFV